jgi:hypothetical protein
MSVSPDMLCPSCGHSRFLEGPWGGLSVNVKCDCCGKKWHFCVPFGWTPIENEDSLYHGPAELMKTIYLTPVLEHLRTGIGRMQSMAADERDQSLQLDVETIRKRHLRVCSTINAARPGTFLGPMDSDAAHQDRGYLLKEIERLKLATPAQLPPLNTEDYLLVCLAEEAAEVVHAVCKSLRFGLQHQWPSRDMTNRDAVREELRDLICLTKRLGLNFDGLPDKGEKFARMMQLSRDLGRLR